MDEDSSAKFIGSLTKFLQSLCNGYVEFQRGVELVGHIYLSIDTGEKVDYILHERVSKGDENSVSFVSNSFHAQPTDKKARPGKQDARPKDARGSEASDDDDIMIVDQSERVSGSTNTGTVPNRRLKHLGGSGSNNRLPQHAAFRSHNQGSSGPMSSQSKNLSQHEMPSATVTSQNMQQDNINMGDVKLEQLSADELLSLASQVDEGGSSSHDSRQQSQVRRASHSLDSSAGQAVWIKQEAPDDSQSQGGHDTGWPRSRDGQSDSSNSGSDLYPVMMHQNPAYSSGPVFPGFSSGQPAAAGSQHHGHSHNFPGTSGAANPYANPGTSQGMSDVDPAAWGQDSRWEDQMRYPSARVGGPRKMTQAERVKLYRQRLKQDPERYQLYLHKASVRASRRRQRIANARNSWNSRTQGTNLEVTVVTADGHKT